MLLLYYLILEQLKVNQTEAVAAVVPDILSPGTALDVDENVRLWLVELNSYNWRQVARGVFVWEIVRRESLPWGVADGSNVFFISGVLSLAGHPNNLLRETFLSFLFYWIINQTYTYNHQYYNIWLIQEWPLKIHFIRFTQIQVSSLDYKLRIDMYFNLPWAFFLGSHLCSF